MIFITCGHEPSDFCLPFEVDGKHVLICKSCYASLAYQIIRNFFLDIGTKLVKEWYVEKQD